MAKGVKPKDPKNKSDIDPLNHLPMLEAISREDTTIEPGCTVLQATAISFARIAEVAVEYHLRSLRHGNVGPLRTRARSLIESTLAEACYVSGRRDELHRLFGEKILSSEQFHQLLKTLELKEHEIWRSAAGYAARILQDIKSRLERIGKKGRPECLSGEIIRDCIAFSA